MSNPFIDSLFAQFQKLKVVVVGDVMVDKYIVGKVDRVSPEAPVPVINAQTFDSRLGGAGNVALNLKALGANAVLCSTIGIDKEGEDLVELLKHEDLSDIALHKSEKRKTTTKTRVIGNGYQIARVDYEITNDCDTLDSYLLQQHFEREIENAHVVILQDYNKGVLHKENIETLINIAHKYNVPVVVDPKKANFLLFKNADLFKPNLKEIKEGLNLDTDLSELDNVIDAINQMKSVLNNKISMVTMSEKGVYIADDNINHHIPAHVRNISDVSGAGDTVISIAACCLAAGCNLKQLAEISNLGGGLVCEEKGVVPINKARLIEEASKLKL